MMNLARDGGRNDQVQRLIHLEWCCHAPLLSKPPAHVVTKKKQLSYMPSQRFFAGNALVVSRSAGHSYPSSANEAQPSLLTTI